MSLMGAVQEKGIDLDALGVGAPRKRVMIVDDEPESVDLMKLILSGAGMDVAGAASGKAALDKCPRIWPDVILLDLMMPEMDGFETYRQLKRITPAPVVMVSARTQKDDVVQGLQFGADDYITKPYHPAELVARVRNIMQRAPAARVKSNYLFPAIEFELDLDTRDVTVRGQTSALPKREFQVLSILARNAPQWVSHRVIATEVWGEDNANARKRIKYLVFLLRRVVEEIPSQPKLIVNREGLGYKLAAE